MEKTYNVGIIGFGFIGSVHACGYENLKFYYRPLPLKAKLFGVCTAHRKTARQAKSVFGFEFATNDFRKLINHPKIDIIHICSPNIFHRERFWPPWPPANTSTAINRLSAAVPKRKRLKPPSGTIPESTR